MKNNKFSKGFSRNIWIMLVMALILGAAFWSVGGSRILDYAPYYIKKVTGDTAQVTIRNNIYDVEIAQTPAARVKGLSARNYLPPGKGMLFIFEEEDYYAFTMEDTEISLDIIWILDNKIVDMKSRAQPGEAVITPLNKANYVLEIGSGNIEVGGFKVDDEVEITFDN